MGPESDTRPKNVEDRYGFGILREANARFGRGEIGVKEYKGISGKYGSYAQKGSKAHMVRLRLAGGDVSKEKLRFIADLIAKYEVGMIHITTCQAIQLHGLSGEQACDLAEEACANGIITIGGGGDYPRNVTASPLSGAEIGESFDVLPYAKEAEGYLLSIIDGVKLPRKLKVGFSNSVANETHATFRDMGFMAKPNGRFDVYSAGGLGSEPKMGLLVAEDADPSEMLYHLKAMVNVFVKHGDYENRAKARTRYMQDSLGRDGYVNAYRRELEAALEQGGMDIIVDGIPLNKKGSGTTEGKRIRPQKQDGLYYVSYHPIGGDPKPSKLEEIYETIRDMPQVGLRTSPDQTLYVINCTAEEAEKVVSVTGDGAETLFESSISCVGAEICQQGLRDSRGLLEELVAMSRKNGFADGVLPRVNISGCVSSCGTHQAGVIGFQGTSVKDDGKSVPAFSLFADGSHLAGEERFGRSVGKMRESDIQPFLEDVGKAVSVAGTDYRSWFDSRRESFLEIARRYVAEE
ncbi:MAG: nitrite/sulfite reductase [Candidatus Methanomethylophilaceae archaeon]